MNATAKSEKQSLLEVDAQGFERAGELGGAARPIEVCPGMTVWQNPLNGFLVLRIHYSADPDKRSDEWRQKAAARMGGLGSPDWRRFMEIDFSVRRGLSVFGPETFVNRVGDPSACHILPAHYPIPVYWSRRRGIDPGIVNAFAVAFWAKSPEGIHFLYDELYIKNAYQLAKTLDHETRLVGLAAVKWYITKKSKGHQFESTYIDPAANQKILSLSFGAESPRANLLEQMLSTPYPIDCQPARRTGSEPVDIEKFRNTIFNRRHYRTLSDETRAVLGLEVNPEGYNLFGGYFLEHCTAHRQEFENLKWAEALDPNVNPTERIQDFDNHTWDASKYALSEEWDQSRKGRADISREEDYRAWRARQLSKDYHKAGQAYASQQSGEMSKSYLETE